MTIRKESEYYVYYKIQLVIDYLDISCERPAPFKELCQRSHDFVLLHDAL